MPAAIQFYDLRTSPLERALPKLMEKAMAAGLRAVIRGTPGQVEALDRALWTYSTHAFLPHGTAADPHPMRQPVYLTAARDNPNGAALLVITDGSAYGEENFERVFDIFDGTDETALAEARARWKRYREQGHALTYIRQKEDGGWEKTAEAA